MKIVLDGGTTDEDIFDWGEHMMLSDDVSAVWRNNLNCALVEEAGRDWVNLILSDGRRITNMSTRMVRLVSSL